MDRRTILRTSVLGGAAALCGGLWSSAALAVAAQPGTGPYGPVGAADGNGIQLPAGFTSRVITPSGVVAPFLRINGQGGSEICGPAFSPDGGRLYLSSQRGTSGSSSGGITYEVRGPFRG